MTQTTPALAVGEFCEKFRISRSMFYKLQRQGKGPRLMKIGNRTLVSAESAREWQQRMEAVA